VPGTLPKAEPPKTIPAPAAVEEVPGTLPKAVVGEVPGTLPKAVGTLPKAVVGEVPGTLPKAVVGEVPGTLPKAAKKGAARRGVEQVPGTLPKGTGREGKEAGKRPGLRRQAPKAARGKMGREGTVNPFGE
jgi:hypothetical protein